MGDVEQCHLPAGPDSFLGPDLLAQSITSAPPVLLISSQDCRGELCKESGAALHHSQSVLWCLFVGNILSEHNCILQTRILESKASAQAVLGEMEEAEKAQHLAIRDYQCRRA